MLCRRQDVLSTMYNKSLLHQWTVIVVLQMHRAILLSHLVAKISLSHQFDFSSMLCAWKRNAEHHVPDCPYNWHRGSICIYNIVIISYQNQRCHLFGASSDTSIISWCNTVAQLCHPWLITKTYIRLTEVHPSGWRALLSKKRGEEYHASRTIVRAETRDGEGFMIDAKPVENAWCRSR